jgi:low affinity Fe/Cu permease
VLAAGAVGFPDAWRVVCEIGVTIITIVLGHFSLGNQN